MRFSRKSSVAAPAEQLPSPRGSGPEPHPYTLISMILFIVGSVALRSSLCRAADVVRVITARSTTRIRPIQQIIANVSIEVEVILNADQRTSITQIGTYLISQ